MTEPTDQRADERAPDGAPHPAFETRAIHAGQPPDRASGAVVTPIYQTSTFAQTAVGEHLGYEYSRSGNPTRTALERCLADLEGAPFGIAFSSGLAAEDAVLRGLAPGDQVLLADDVYGGTYRLLSQVHAGSGVTASLDPLDDVVALARRWPARCAMVWIESPTNPRLRVIDIAAVAELAHARGAIVVVDNTFATPYLQRPLELGADVVVHSTTKYLGGHSDVVGGLVATADPGVAERVSFLQNAAGAVPGPLDCFLTLRGIKTLAVRMDRHCHNAAAVARMLTAHPAVAGVCYPGLADHPTHRVAARQMRGYGGMVSFTVRGGEKQAVAVAGATRVFTLADSLGPALSAGHPR